MYIMLLKVYCSSFSAMHQVRSIKKKGKTWKVQCGSSQWKVQYIVYEKNMEITV